MEGLCCLGRRDRGFLCPSCCLELPSACSALCAFVLTLPLGRFFSSLSPLFLANFPPVFKAPLKHPKQLCLVAPPQGASPPLSFPRTLCFPLVLALTALDTQMSLGHSDPR